MIPSACRVEACQPWRRGDPPCRGSCRASSRTAREGWGSREGGGEVRRARRWFDGVEGSRSGRGRGGGAIFCARRAGGAGWVWSRQDAGRARRGAEGRKEFARRGARTARGVFLSLALPAVISWSDGMAHAPEVESSFPSPRRSTSEAEAGTDAHALAARRPRESSRGVARTHQEASLSATRPRRARARLRCDGAGRADTESASSRSHILRVWPAGDPAAPANFDEQSRWSSCWKQNVPVSSTLAKDYPCIEQILLVFWYLIRLFLRCNHVPTGKSHKFETRVIPKDLSGVRPIAIRSPRPRAVHAAHLASAAVFAPRRRT